MSEDKQRKPKSISAAKSPAPRTSFNLMRTSLVHVKGLMKEYQLPNVSHAVRFSLRLATTYAAGLAIDPKRIAKEAIDEKSGPIDLETARSIQPDDQITSPFVLKDTFVPSRGFDYSQIIEEAEKLFLVFNDMYNWIKNHDHRQKLMARMTENKRPTTIYLIHPKSPVVDYVAEKSNKLHQLAKTGENRQIYDIKRSLFFLLGDVLDKEISLTRVVGHQWVHAYSMVMDDKAAYVTPYLNKKVGNDGIIHVYRAGPESPTGYMYRDLKDDLEDMERYTVNLPSLNLIKYAREHPEDMRAELYVD